MNQKALIVKLGLTFFQLFITKVLLIFPLTIVGLNLIGIWFLFFAEDVMSGNFDFSLVIPIASYLGVNQSMIFTEVDVTGVILKIIFMVGLIATSLELVFSKTYERVSSFCKDNNVLLYTYTGLYTLFIITLFLKANLFENSRNKYVEDLLFIIFIFIVHLIAYFMHKLYSVIIQMIRHVEKSI